jgi:cation diffusion facilitator CzcD-associated flavoprotein CzcO
MREEKQIRREVNMVASQAVGHKPKTETSVDFDAVVIGAGVSGLYQIYKLRELGLKVRAFETGSNLGGTWYWNRYPGCRFDSESYTYGYFFSKELLKEWRWTEHFAAQPETERYLNYVADKFDLRRDIQFNSRVVAAYYQEEMRGWKIALEDGSRYSTRFLVTALGVLSAAIMPAIAGIDTFKGQSYHTSRWPKEAVNFDGKRVAVIGAGATGVQAIQEVAKTVGHLTVFQRTPNWCVPLRNDKISDEKMRSIRDSYSEIYARCQETPSCLIHVPDSRATHEVTPEEREAFWEKLYDEPGLGLWVANFRDILVDRRANALISDFVARKIRQRVKHPIVAEKLIPKNHGFGTRRVPLETNYYEVYNQPNVQLVDINETPIERITPTGIKTRSAEYEFDIIIYATGFDAITGSFDRIDIRGVDGVRLIDKWKEGPQTYLGILVDGFPNMLMVMGPHSQIANYPRAAEYSVEWITRLIRYTRDHELTRIDATPGGIAEWTDHVNSIGHGLLHNEIDSWMTGVNTNIAGKQTRKIMRYSGGHPVYREHCEAVVADEYRKLALE